MPVVESSIPRVLRERASLQPNDTAFTFIDYEQDPAGCAESLTWAQVYRRALNVAHELRGCASAGDRALILAPQGLDYVVAFLGALQAGLIAVPLSDLQLGAHDERINSVLRNSSASVILTTSAVVGDVVGYAVPQRGRSAPTVIEVDLLDWNSRNESGTRAHDRPEAAYLQYTSGSTREPAGVMVSYRNLQTNFQQMTSAFFPAYGKVAPPGTTGVSWLPLYHDMGLLLGICAPILGGWHTILMSPVAFLQRPARWIQLMARNPRALTAAPNFALELAARKTSDEDMAGLDLGDALCIFAGAERIHSTTLKRFAGRFARFNFSGTVIRPCYGLAEATLYVATRRPGDFPEIVDFEPEKLTAGLAQRCSRGSGASLVSYGVPLSPVVRIVDPETRMECMAGTVGEIWVCGDNVASGYWGRPDETEDTFGARLVAAPAGTPEGPWLRTGDLGVISEGELFVMGRIKDVLIVYGRNHYPDDIEATIQEITGGRVAAIAVPDARTEKLVAIIELKKRGDSDDDAMQEKFRNVKNQVTSAISTSHGLSVADLVLAPPGSIPITTSGKIRRAACAEQYRHDEFTRLDGLPAGIS